MNDEKWMTTAQASQTFGVSQRYIRYLCKGRRRRKGKAVWFVEPKIAKYKVHESEHGKQTFMIDAKELKTHFKNRLEQNDETKNKG